MSSTTKASSTGRMVVKRIIRKVSTPGSNTAPSLMTASNGGLRLGVKRSAEPNSTDEVLLKKPSTVVRLRRSVSPADQQRLEVPVQKKTRVLPEQEGSYKIIMPQGKTAKTQKVLENRCKFKLKR
jgi:hypothetical protein